MRLSIAALAKNIVVWYKKIQRINIVIIVTKDKLDPQKLHALAQGKAHISMNPPKGIKKRGNKDQRELFSSRTPSQAELEAAAKVIQAEQESGAVDGARLGPLPGFGDEQEN